MINIFIFVTGVYIYFVFKCLYYSIYFLIVYIVYYNQRLIINLCYTNFCKIGL